jgi:hypothetical protein
MHRFNHFVSVLAEERGMEGLALFRAKINPFAAVPLTTLPNKPERKFGNDAFQWCLNDRVQMTQPSATSTLLCAQNCNCWHHPVVGTGRHFRTCTKQGGNARFHDHMRDTLITTVSAAGLTVAREPKGKLPAEPELRPGDLCISDWTVDGMLQTEHCIDFASPVVNGGWSSLANDEKLLRSCLVGVAGKRIGDSKSAKKGSMQEQQERGDDFSMKERCRSQHINFWPVAIEVDGAVASIFLRFFNNVCDAASNLTEQNRVTFKHYCTGPSALPANCTSKTPVCPFSALFLFVVICGDCQLPRTACCSATSYRPNSPAPFLIDPNSETASGHPEMPTEPAVPVRGVACCR